MKDSCPNSLDLLWIGAVEHGSLYELHESGNHNRPERWIAGLRRLWHVAQLRAINLKLGPRPRDRGR